IQHVQVLSLVLVQPFYLDVEERLRIDRDAGSLLENARQRLLVVSLDGPPVALERRVVSQRLEAGELFLEVRNPRVADVPRDERAQCRVAQDDPAPPAPP